MHTWPQILVIVIFSASLGSAASSDVRGRFREYVIGSALILVPLYFGGFFSSLGI